MKPDLQLPKLTKDNILDHIEAGLVYHSNTPSGWATMYCDTSKAGFVDDPLSFSYPVDLPEVPALLDVAHAEIKAKRDAERVAFESRFFAATEGLVCIHMANDIKHEVREQHGLFESPYGKDRTDEFGVEADIPGFWYHGYAKVRVMTDGRVCVTYGGCFDIWVKPDDPAAILKKNMWGRDDGGRLLPESDKK